MPLLPGKDALPGEIEVFTAYLFGNSGYLPIFAANIAAALAQHELVLKMIDKGYLHADEVLWRNSLEHSFILTHQVGVYVVLPTMVIFAVVSFRSKRVYRGMCLSSLAATEIAVRPAFFPYMIGFPTILAGQPAVQPALW